MKLPRTNLMETGFLSNSLKHWENQAFGILNKIRTLRQQEDSMSSFGVMNLKVPDFQ